MRHEVHVQVVGVNSQILSHVIVCAHGEGGILSLQMLLKLLVDSSDYPRIRTSRVEGSGKLADRLIVARSGQSAKVTPVGPTTGKAKHQDQGNKATYPEWVKPHQIQKRAEQEPREQLTNESRTMLRGSGHESRWRLHRGTLPCCE
jgi:hypothetical protein